MFVPEYSFTVTEHDSQRPSIVVGQQTRTVELEDGANFFERAHRAWPAPRFTSSWILTRRAPAGSLRTAEDEFLTVTDIARILKLNQQTVRNMIDRGELPAYHVGRRVRVSRRDFDRFVEARYQCGAFQAGR
jgi:excisionase family DNA binding protein